MHATRFQSELQLVHLAYVLDSNRLKPGEPWLPATFPSAARELRRDCQVLLEPVIYLADLG